VDENVTYERRTRKLVLIHSPIVMADVEKKKINGNNT